MKRLGSFRAFAIAIAALSAVFAFSTPGHAQDDSYVDLSIEVAASVTWTFTARNQGTATAYGVTVDIELADQTIDSHGDQFKERDTTCSGNIPTASATCSGGDWTIGSLGAGEEISIKVKPKLASGSGLPSTGKWSVPARAVINPEEDTVPEEAKPFKHNNTAIGWIYVDTSGSAERARVQYWLEASVDNPLAKAGEEVEFRFKVTAIPSSSRKFVDEAKVRLTLDEGMGTPSHTPLTETFAAPTGSTRTWDWTIGKIPVNPPELVVSTRLDSTASSGLCLNAELTARPDSTHTDPSEPTHTSAEICLRKDPVVLLQEGEAILWNMYPCVGVTTYPCPSDDTLEMRVVGRSAARAAGITRDEAVLDPDKVFIQVKDPQARLIDTQNHSVNGTVPSWQTAREPDSRSGDRTVGGVEISYTRKEFTSAQIANYSNLARTMAVTALDGGEAPGKVKVRFPGSGSAFYDLTTTGTVTKPTFGLNSPSTSVIPYFAEFSTLGTYKIAFTADVTHTDTTVYSGTGSYIFHVGPVAELEVSDGDGGLAPAGTRAFNIVAVNNGPDDAPAVKVSLSGLDAGSCTGNYTKGSIEFDNGECVWTIRELKTREFNQDIYGRDGEVLTIITSAAVDTPITASISNDQNYEVCIDSSGDDVDAGNQADCKTESGNTNVWYSEVCVQDSNKTINTSATHDTEAECAGQTGHTWTDNVCASSAGAVQAAGSTEAICFGWHTTSYYDYISDNDSATIKAKDGTGAALPSLRGARASAAAIVVSWDEIAEVNGRKVAHYEVQREPNPWTEPVTALEPRYVDTGIRVGDTHRYRVRAINDRGQGGPWSAPLSVSVAPEPTPTPRPTPEPDPEPSNSSPRFTDGSSTTRHIQENSEPGTDVGSPVAATDKNRDRLTYELTGTDADSFEIVASSGQIRTKAKLDYETKTRYRVTVTVSDGKNSRGEANENVDDVIEVTIAVTNQGEQGSITFSEALPVVGTEIEAELTDPDGGLSRVSWAWERSADGDAWAGISGAASASYTPAAGDAGHYLRVTASYTDRHGPSKSATAALSVPVTALSVSQRYDGDGDGSISLGEALQAAGDYRAGTITYDEAIAVANLYFESQSS